MREHIVLEKKENKVGEGRKKDKIRRWNCFGDPSVTSLEAVFKSS